MIIPCTTDELYQEAMLIRHEVYCEDNDWEEFAEDEYDPHSKHFLIMEDNQFVATARMIYPVQGLPTAKQVRLNDMGFIEPSRFCYSKRRTKTTQIHELLQGLVQVTEKGNLWICSMEYRLIHRLKSLGIECDIVGPAMEYHGKRFPCVLYPEQVEFALGGPDLETNQLTGRRIRPKEKTMLFKISWTSDMQNYGDAVDKFMADGVDTPKGVQVLSRYHYASGKGGFAITEIDDLVAAAGIVRKWDHLLDYEFEPLITDGEINSLSKD